MIRALPMQTVMSTTESLTVDLDDSIEVKDLGILTYQIPMKPFVLIEINGKKSELLYVTTASSTLLV